MDENFISHPMLYISHQGVLHPMVEFTYAQKFHLSSHSTVNLNFTLVRLCSCFQIGTVIGQLSLGEGGGVIDHASSNAF